MFLRYWIAFSHKRLSSRYMYCHFNTCVILHCLPVYILNNFYQLETRQVLCVHVLSQETWLLCIAVNLFSKVFCSVVVCGFCISYNCISFSFIVFHSYRKCYRFIFFIFIISGYCIIACWSLWVLLICEGHMVTVYSYFYFSFFSD